MKRAVGYVRVSSKRQATEGESLSTQKNAINNWINSQGWKLVEIYADEGKSGGTVEGRPALKRLLHDAEARKYDAVVIYRLSRFGRNNRELQNNVHILKNLGITFCSITEKIDLSTPQGRFFFDMLGAMAQFERDIIREQVTENKIAIAKKGIPSAGRLPFGRNYNKKTGKWSLDKQKAKLIRWAAEEYLSGRMSLRNIAKQLRLRHGLKMAHITLVRILSNRCGDVWVQQFKNEEPIKFKIPSILDKDTITAIKERLAFNKTNNRHDVRKYLLSGFLRCESCGKVLIGQTQEDKYTYYRHIGNSDRTCRAFSSISAKKIEKAVFATIFKNTIDVKGFKKAIKDSLPDKKQINLLKKNIAENEKKLRAIEKELDKLVDLAVKGALKKATIQKREKDLYALKQQLTDEFENDKRRLESIPSLEKIEAEAEVIRERLLKYFGSEDRLDKMTYGEKRELLHWLFDGRDEDGKPYGIYVSKYDGDKWDYYISAHLFGTIRTLKGDDIDYWDEGGEGNGSTKHNTNYICGGHRDDQDSQRGRLS
jgi:site-specific DNA recombinase